MKIAIDALGIHYLGGGRTATLSLLESLLAIDEQNQYLFLLSQPEPTLESTSGNAIQWIAPTQNRILLRIWAQIYIPIITRKYDLVHFIKNLGVYGVNPPTIVTVYDLTTLVHPELFPQFDVLYWRYIQKRTLQNANKIIAISDATANDICRYYDISRENIRVIYPAFSNIFKPASPERINQVHKQYNLPEEYILHVGRIDRKKNLTMLVQAFANFRKQTGNETKLVLVGEEYLKSIDMELNPTIEQLGLTKEVVFTGIVPDVDLPPLYSGALTTVFPSLHEGFGLAPLEAMACGSPLIAHITGGLSEVAGDAAIRLETVTIDSIADSICKVVTDPELRSELQRRGLARSRQFQGNKSAYETLKLYKEMLTS